MTHMVMFRFADPQDTEGAAHRLLGMAGRIPGMTAVRIGHNRHEGSAAFDLVLVTEHESADALRDYADHPVHREVGEWLSPRISDRAVVDTDGLGD